MDFLNDLLGFIETAVEGIFHFIGMLIYWSLSQIAAVPWNQLSYLPPWKIMFLSVLSALILVYVYRMMWAFWEAGEKAMAALIILTTVFIRSLPIIVIAGLVAAMGCWVVNNVNF
ncbi:MAG: hypothetical protein WCD20_04680 [Rhodomicrobium sp.]